MAHELTAGMVIYTNTGGGAGGGIPAQMKWTISNPSLAEEV